MQRIYVDFSVFAPFGAVGVIDGYIECAAIPRRGESISFMSPKTGILPFVAPGFTGLVDVERVIHSPNPEAHVALSLEAITLADDEHVKSLVQLMEQGFGLGFTPHPNWRGSA